MIIAINIIVNNITTTTRDAAAMITESNAQKKNCIEKGKMIAQDS